MDALHLIPPDALLALARRTDGIHAPCACVDPARLGWTSMSISVPETLLSPAGTLVNAEPHELSVEEYHPAGTHLWSVDAPIAIGYYPCNHCTVWTCRTCGRAFLHYVEGGGYYVDRRIRLLSTDVLVIPGA